MRLKFAGAPVMALMSLCVAGSIAVAPGAPAGATSSVLSNTLVRGTSLVEGSALASANGYVARLETNGNFVITAPSGVTVWSDGMNNYFGPNSIKLLSNGDLVDDLWTGYTLWSSGTKGDSTDVLSLETDGDLVLSDPGYSVWSSMTGLLGAPSIAMTAGNAEALISWSFPSAPGASPITSYTARSSPGDLSCTTANTTCTVTGLRNTTSYSFSVTAANALGPSSAVGGPGKVTPSALARLGTTIGPVLADEETASYSVSRDTGKSVVLPNGEDLWIFGDTTELTKFGGSWSGTGFVTGSSSAEAPYIAGQVPTGLTEVVPGMALGQGGVSLWNAGTSGTSPGELRLEDGGDLVLSSSTGKPLWSSETGKVPNPKAQPTVPLSPASPSVLLPGSTLTEGESLTSPSHLDTAVLGADGDFVISAGGKQIWTTRTSRADATAGTVLTLKPSGNLVLSAAPQPTRLVPTPTDLYVPNSAGKRCPQTPGTYAARWVTGAALMPDGSDVLITYEDNCVLGPWNFPEEGWGFMEYDWQTNTISVPPTDVFAPATSGAALANEDSLGSPVIVNGSVTLYSTTCPPKSILCAGGGVFAVTMPATTAALETKANYVPQKIDTDGSVAWHPLFVNVGVYPSGLKLVEQTDLGGGFTVFSASTPAGPWVPEMSGVIPGCQSVPNGFCYALIGHPEISSASELMISYYDPTSEVDASAGHLDVASFPLANGQ
jgi:hypothetical protein